MLKTNKLNKIKKEYNCEYINRKIKQFENKINMIKNLIKGYEKENKNENS